MYIAEEYEACICYAPCGRSAPSSHVAGNFNKRTPFWNLVLYFMESMSVCLFMSGLLRLPSVTGWHLMLFFSNLSQLFDRPVALHITKEKLVSHKEYINLNSHWMMVVNTKESHHTETPFQVQFNDLLKLPS